MSFVCGSKRYTESYSILGSLCRSISDGNKVYWLNKKPRCVSRFLYSSDTLDMRGGQMMWMDRVTLAQQLHTDTLAGILIYTYAERPVNPLKP